MENKSDVTLLKVDEKRSYELLTVRVQILN